MKTEGPLTQDEGSPGGRSGHGEAKGGFGLTGRPSLGAVQGGRAAREPSSNLNRGPWRVPAPL